jgi:hypothetical protein
VAEQTVNKTSANNRFVLDHMGDSKALSLVGPDALALPAQYRVEVEDGSKAV